MWLTPVSAASSGDGEGEGEFSGEGAGGESGWGGVAGDGDGGELAGEEFETGVGEGEEEGDLTDECGVGAGESADEAMLTSKERRRRIENLATAWFAIDLRWRRWESVNLNRRSLDLELNWNDGDEWMRRRIKTASTSNRLNGTEKTIKWIWKRGDSKTAMIVGFLKGGDLDTRMNGGSWLDWNLNEGPLM